jgi:hypothetical protein
MTRQQKADLKREIKSRLRRGLTTPAAELAKAGARPPKKRRK